jgi:hypothetical protein
MMEGQSPLNVSAKLTLVHGHYIHLCSVHPFTFFQSRHDYQTAVGRVEAKRRQWLGPPLATTNHFLAELSDGPWVSYIWVEVSHGFLWVDVSSRYHPLHIPNKFRVADKEGTFDENVPN